MTLKEVLAEHEERTIKSRSIYEEARKYLPGGVSGSGKFMKPYPLYIKEAKGCRIIDVDGNEYIDLLMGQGVNILGYANEIITFVVKEALDSASQTFISQEIEYRLAKRIIDNIEPLEMIRFVNTGSEATSMCARAARAFTKRDKIAKFEGHYHGQSDLFLISGLNIDGHMEKPVPKRDGAGIPKDTLNNIIILPFNDIDACNAIIEKNSSEIAALILEPVAGFMAGCVPIEKEFLIFIKEITSKHNILLIYDEVVTGFRLSLGGASEFFGISPDMIALGKIIGGGFPIGAYGGKRELMEKVVTPTKTSIDLEEKIFQSGTFTGNPISMIAGLTTIKELEKGEVIPYINDLGEYMRENISIISNRLNGRISLTGLGSLFQIHFTDKAITNKRDTLNEDKSKATEFFYRMINNGVYLPPSHPALLSSAHSKNDMNLVLDIIEKVLTQMK